jgi:hypothetical protein
MSFQLFKAIQKIVLVDIGIAYPRSIGDKEKPAHPRGGLTGNASLPGGFAVSFHRPGERMARGRR